jgi:hypothetical protein
MNLEGIRIFLWVERVLAVAVVAGLLYIAAFIVLEGYLPLPYFYGSQSLFTDWTVSAYFAHNRGEYKIFATVYPPISFVFLRIFSIRSCYGFYDIFASRDCDWVAYVVLVGFYVLNVILVFLAYRKNDQSTAISRTIAIVLGLPGLYALERGNLIIPCFTFFVLGNSRILRSARLKWLCSALAINFKPYLIMALAGLLVRRRWRWFEGCALAGLFVYLVTLLINGDGNPLQILNNIVAFDTADTGSMFNHAIYASSYKPIMDLLASNFPLMRFVGSKPLEFLDAALPLVINLGKLGIVCAFVIAMLRPHIVPIVRLSALAIAWVLITSDPGGYSVLFLFFLVLLDKGRGVFMIVAIVLTYVLSISGDLMVMKVAHQLLESYLTKREVGYDLGLNLGEIARPGLVLLIIYALVAATIGDAVTDQRARWRARLGGVLGDQSVATA